MQGFVRQRYVFTDKGDPSCKHSWKGEACELCPARRRVFGGYTASWWTTDPSTGKRRQHSKGGFRTKGEAQKHLNSVLGKVADGGWTPDKPLTVKQLLLEHWLPAQEDALRPATRAQYRHVAEDWIVPHIGATRVAALSPADVKTWTDTLRTSRTAKGRKGLSARSVQLSVQVLKASTRWALGAHLLGRDPIAGVRRPKAASHKIEPWTVEEARAFLAATADDRLAFAWALLLTRGLRRGDLCGLRWGAVDLDAGRIQISETRIVVDGEAIESEPKTDSGRRSIPLDAKLVTLLRAHLLRQRQEKLANGEAYEGPVDYLVADEIGQPYHPDHISDRFEDLTKSAKLRRIRLHDTRHTALTLMMADGVNPKVVQELAGHSSIQITLGIYGHVMPGMSEAAGEALSTSLLG